MKITKSQLKQIIKEELQSVANEGVLSRAAAKMGFGPEVKKRKEEAVAKLRAAGLKYIEDYQDAEVGPFLEKGSKDDRRSWETDYTWSNALENAKRYPDDVKKSIFAQAQVLENILDAYTQESKVNWDSDNAPLDVSAMAEAHAMPSLYQDVAED